MRNAPTKVILHCAATPDYTEASLQFDNIGAKEIDAWHRRRGFNKIGYHEVIRQSGVREYGRDYKEIGAHCKGQNNGSLGICWVGTYRPNHYQLATLVNLYFIIKAEFEIDYSQWYGHYEFNPLKECPGFSMDLFRLMLKFAEGCTP